MSVVDRPANDTSVLRLACNRAGLSQNRLAQLAEVSPGMVRRPEVSRTLTPALKRVATLQALRYLDRYVNGGRS